MQALKWSVGEKAVVSAFSFVYRTREKERPNKETFVIDNKVSHFLRYKPKHYLTKYKEMNKAEI